MSTHNIPNLKDLRALQGARGEGISGFKRMVLLCRGEKKAAAKKGCGETEVRHRQLHVKKHRATSENATFGGVGSSVPLGHTTIRPLRTILRDRLRGEHLPERWEAIQVGGIPRQQIQNLLFFLLGT